MRTNNVPVSGSLLLAKADALAAALGDTSFKATTGFIDRWKTRHGIIFKKVCGEERDVLPHDAENWLSITLPELLGRFLPEDVYNLDETGLFYHRHSILRNVVQSVYGTSGIHYQSQCLDDR